MNIVYKYFAVFVLGFLAVYSLTPLIIKLALKWNFVDNPCARKVHKTAVPLMGGISVFIGFLFLVIIVIALNLHALNIRLIGYLAGAFVILVVGIIDDRNGMQPIPKMIGQLAACLLFIYSSDMWHVLGPTWLSVTVILLWMIGLMNAFNFLDNMDGVLAGMSGILGLGFYAISYLSKTPEIAHLTSIIGLMSMTFAGCVLGFLPYNFNPAKIFLGDAGSMFIGYFLSTMGLLSGNLMSQSKDNHIWFLIPVLLLSFAIFDITLVSYTRRRDGRRISQGGKDHSTHRIGNATGSTKVTAVFVYLINIILVLATILVLQMNSTLLLVSSTCLFAIVFFFLGKKLDQIPVVIPHNQLKITPKQENK
ncbi:MAG: undecaprenyl/decaprenyl-phosphate alpha-N-acetylglucosaminyl 1-phosphate transferase [Candidatus Cloacimonetes bacterium]|nr:undecaprenyl/decaprenyl-phosphate alpha-N-acetylglucosaminyl 1-phosphate transferase [Candidatus Cloacimonadota bacterium]